MDCPKQPGSRESRAKPGGCGSRNRYQNGTLASGNMDQNLRNPSCLILSHAQVVFIELPREVAAAPPSAHQSVAGAVAVAAAYCRFVLVGV